MLPTNDVVCVRVQRDNDRGSGGDNGGWHTSLPAPTGNRERIVIRLGGLLRRFIPIPHDAALVAGRYVANVTLCGVADYRLATPSEVVDPSAPEAQRAVARPRARVLLSARGEPPPREAHATLPAPGAT